MREAIVKEGVLTKFIKDLKDKTTLSNLIFSLIIGLIAVNASLLVHESGHVLSSRLMGVEAGINNLNTYTGSTGVGETTQHQFWIIAFAGPAFALIYGLYLFFLEKDGVLRVGGIVSIFYSVLPSLFPCMAGSDAAQAIAQGFNPLLAWIIYIVVFSYTFKLIIEEVIDRKIDF